MSASSALRWTVGRLHLVDARDAGVGGAQVDAVHGHQFSSFPMTTPAFLQHAVPRPEALRRPRRPPCRRALGGARGPVEGRVVGVAGDHLDPVGAGPGEHLGHLFGDRLQEGARVSRLQPGRLAGDRVVEPVEAVAHGGEGLLEQAVAQFLVLGVQPVDDLLAVGRALVLPADLFRESRQCAPRGRRSDRAQEACESVHVIRRSLAPSTVSGNFLLRATDMAIAVYP